MIFLNAWYTFKKIKENWYKSKKNLQRVIILSVFQKIYNVVCKIPKGKVATYGQVATLAGNPRWARVVGYALHNNPAPMVIPCHRVVNREGKVAESFVFGGGIAQRELLEKEGIVFEKDGTIDFKKYGWRPEF